MTMFEALVTCDGCNGPFISGQCGYHCYTQNDRLPVDTWEFAGRIWFLWEPGCGYLHHEWRSDRGDILSVTMERFPILNGETLRHYGEDCIEILEENAQQVEDHFFINEIQHDPYEQYGTMEHEALLMAEERGGL